MSIINIKLIKRKEINCITNNMGSKPKNGDVLNIVNDDGQNIYSDKEKVN